MGYTWGFDIGTNSVGWAVLDIEGEQIIASGVRIFPEGSQDINSKKEVSNNAARRMFRLIRRQYRRRKMRKETLLKSLQNARLAPDSPKELELFFTLDPYSLRTKGLDEQLSLHELGRALYHLNQRRGFKSNRKIDNQEKEGEDTSGVVKSKIAELKATMEERDAPTLGAYLAQVREYGAKIRGRYTDRSMLVDEFDELWYAQKKYYPDILSEKLYDALRNDIIFFQRGLKSQKGTIGKCQFEKNKPRSPMCGLLFQEFRMWQAINNLTVIGGSRISDEDKYLTIDEKHTLASYLSKNPSLDLTKPTAIKTLAKLLNFPPLPKGEYYAANLRLLPCNDTYRRLRRALGDDILCRFTSEQLERMTHTLQFAEDEDKTISYAIKTWELSPEEAKKFANTALEDGYGSLSAKAIRKILPFLKEGMMYHEACEKAGYDHSAEDEVPLTGEIPRINPKDIRNPIVIVALGQVRHVGNELFNRFGQPDCIRVEMGRELRIPAKRRAEIDFQNRKLDADAKDISQMLISELQLQNPSRQDILRYRLWKEVRRCCPYTGEDISLRRLFFEDVDIDHILPYSKTLNDSQANKTICVRAANAKKGNSIPSEAFSRTQYDEMIERVKKSNMSPRKKELFAMKSEKFEEKNGDFITRQLNDTRHIAKKARLLLKNLSPKVTVGNGSVTAHLRRQWGLNSLLSPTPEVVSEDTAKPTLEDPKNRLDHRHHAIDAICIAFTSEKLMQVMSTSHALDYVPNGEKAPKIPKPWEFIRRDIWASISDILVSYKVNKRARGRMHEDTFYGQRHTLDGKPMTDERKTPLYVVRQKLAGFQDTNKVYGIIDPVVKETVFERLVEKGVPRQKLDAEEKVTIPKDAFAEPLYLKTKSGKLGPVIESVRRQVPSNNMRHIENTKTGATRFVEPGNNHHYAIYQDANGKRSGDIVTLFEAYRRIRDKEPVIRRETNDGRTFVCSLQINELWLMDLHPDEVEFENPAFQHVLVERLYRVQKISEGQITLLHHLHARELNLKKERLSMGKSPTKLQGFKVRISPSGKLEQAFD
jgi:CRISPR-associated endonuclease Csn1